MKKLVIVSLLCLAPLVTACQTVQGAGKDVTSVGEAMEDAAN